jgi:hypothetical protein
MAALDTVADYIAQARVLLQDTIETYRYSDAEIRAALNLGMTEARRIRPDMFIGRLDAVPFYTASETVDFDVQYRMALLYYIIGHVQLRDDEDTTDARAAALLTKFVAQLTQPNA